MGALSTDPVTVPASGDFYSAMTLLTFRAFDLRSAVLEKFGGSTGCPVFTDERTQVKGHHVKIAPCSPQWQRKLESPLRVILACINSSPDHNSGMKITVLWKTLTLLQPMEGQDFKDDIVAWARLFYFEDQGEFKGRLEITRDLEKILMAAPTETTTLETTLWSQKWNQIQWGAQYELDQAEAAAMSKARAACPGGKGLQLGKGNRHWSSAAIHTNYYEPFPFHLDFVVVDSIYFSWDEMCDKFQCQDKKVGDYSVATHQGAPPADCAGTGSQRFHSSTFPDHNSCKGQGQGQSSAPFRQSLTSPFRNFQDPTLAEDRSFLPDWTTTLPVLSTSVPFKASG